MKIYETYVEKREKAMLILAKLGAVKYVKDTTLYHGRAGDGSKWEVDPNFNNAGNLTGNLNVNEVSALNAAEDINIAKIYARRGEKQSSGVLKAESPYKIQALDKDAVVFNKNFDASKLSEEEQKEYFAALEVLTKFDVSEANPVKFELRQYWANVVAAVNKVFTKNKEFSNKDEWQLISTEELKKIKQIIGNSGIYKIKFQGVTSEELFKMIDEYVEAYNTQILLKKFPTIIFRKYLEDKSFFSTGDINFKRKINSSRVSKNIPISSAYFSAWSAHNHIIGLQHMVDSPTAGIFQGTVFFNLSKIMTEKGRGEMIQECMQEYGAIAERLEDLANNSEVWRFLTNANSKEVMDYIYQSPECRELYEKKDGNWEGWKVGQHTQAVLDFFDKYYQNDFPDNLQPFIKIVMLAHDIGKGYAKEQGITQKEGTKIQVEKLYDALNLPEGYRKLINFVILQSQDYTSQLIKNHNSEQRSRILSELKGACKQAYKESVGLGSSEVIDALVKICITLQNCDSGAYTRFASVQEGDVHVTGGNDGFTSSFSLDKKRRPRLKNVNSDVSVR